MQILGGYVIATPTKLGPADLPHPLWTISPCLLPDLPGPSYGDWFTDRTHAEAVLKTTGVEADLLAVGIEEALANDLRADRADWWARNPALAISPGGKRETSVDEPGADDFFQLLDQQLPLPPDAETLGYELVGLETDFTFHSWHCFPFAAERRALGVTLAPNGLLADHGDALRVLDLIREEPPYEVPWTVATLAVVGK
ncbi:hypothetical protein GCM10009745_81850 [Kribbella yunnanensis]|uniref:Uncharacterized protein n=1 Tax=Kribbella yunnanensis TaxID=190194 RepID=A0ABP4V9V9_9ACTN